MKTTKQKNTKMSKRYISIYRTGDEYNTIEHNGSKEMEQELANTKVDSVIFTQQVRDITWNTGEEPFDLTDDDIRKVVDFRIKFDKVKREVLAYNDRWKWVFIPFSMLFRVPFMLLQLVFFVLSNAFAFCESGCEWVHEKIEFLIGEKLMYLPIRDKIKLYWKMNFSSDGSIYNTQRERHDAIFGRDDENTEEGESDAEENGES